MGSNESRRRLYKDGLPVAGGDLTVRSADGKHVIISDWSGGAMRVYARDAFNGWGSYKGYDADELGLEWRYGS